MCSPRLYCQKRSILHFLDPQAMELLSVIQRTGDVDELSFATEKQAGNVSAPVMGGISELLHSLQLDSQEHNPFVDPAPVIGTSLPACNASRTSSPPLDAKLGILSWISGQHMHYLFRPHSRLHNRFVSAPDSNVPHVNHNNISAVVLLKARYRRPCADGNLSHNKHAGNSSTIDRVTDYAIVQISTSVRATASFYK
jgi:hypothetical protein